jgi:hypothetical protein
MRPTTRQPPRREQKNENVRRSAEKIEERARKTRRSVRKRNTEERETTDSEVNTQKTNEPKRKIKRTTAEPKERKKKRKKNTDNSLTQWMDEDGNLTMWVPGEEEMEFAGDRFGNTATHPFKTEAILKHIHLISNHEMRKEVRDGLTRNWDSGFTGPTNEFKDDAIELKPEVETKILKQLQKEVEQGWTVGPFERPPFPNEWCKRQPFITRMFAIQKNKWQPSDLSIRIISHSSWPPGQSVNDFTARKIPGVVYYTIAMFISKVARAGKGALVSLIDVMHAYKNILLMSKCWHQQIVRAFGQYYAQLRGTFGSVAAGDAFITFIMGIREIVCTRLGLKGLDVYVDNFDNTVPGVEGVPDFPRANREHKAFVSMLREEFGFPLHEEKLPATSVDAHLGWQLDTLSRMVGMTAARMKMLLTLLAEWLTKTWYALKELRSLIGVVAFVSCVVPGLGAHLRHLRAEEFRQFPQRRKFGKARMTDRIQWVVRFLIDFIERTKGQTRLYDMDWSRGATINISTDASYEAHKGLQGGAGCGAICWQLGLAMGWKVSEEVRERAKRTSALSIPYLECFTAVMMLESLGDTIAGQRIMVTIDCEPAYKAARKRFSGNNDLREIIQRMDQTAATIGYSVRFELVGRDENSDADGLAKDPDSVDAFVQGRTAKSGQPFSVITPVVPQPLSW